MKPRVLLNRGVAVALFAFLLALPVFGDEVELIKDIDTTTKGSFPRGFAFGEDVMYFRAQTLETGSELFATDGTAEGTELLVDVRPGASGGLGSSLVLFDDLIIFVGSTTEEGSEPFRSDGTVDGTYVIEDINEDGNSFPRHLTVIGDLVYFSAETPDLGRELYVTDGTAEGTIGIDIDTTAGMGTDPRGFVEFDGQAYFFVTTERGPTLWRSDGSVSGTEPGLTLAVDEKLPLREDSGIVVYDEELYFVAEDDDSGVELWKTDGDIHELVADINEFGDSMPNHFAVHDGLLYFSATNGFDGRELWKTDGSEAGTEMAADIWYGSTGSDPDNLVSAGDTLYFAASDEDFGREPWKTIDTGNGVTRVADVLEGVFSSFPVDFLVHDSNLYFRASNFDVGFELFRSDGTSEGTVALEINPGNASGFGEFVGEVNGQVLMTGRSSEHGYELFTIDEDETEPVLLVDLNMTTEDGVDNTPVTLDDVFMFRVFLPDTGSEPWASDGTEEGTTILTDIADGATWSYPNGFTRVGDAVYFDAFDFTHGGELWKTDGTESGTEVIELRDGIPSTDPTDLVEFDGELIFAGFDSSFDRNVYKSDGTVEGTESIISFPFSDTPHGFVQFDDRLFFGVTGTDAPGLYWTDFDEETYVSTPEDPQDFTEHDGRLYFSATSDNGRELWKTDGTLGGTSQVANIVSDGDSSPTLLTSAGDYLFFVATTPDEGTELWRTNGSEDGTVLVADLTSGPESAAPWDLTEYDGELHFSAWDEERVHREWMKTDGTTDGTVVVGESLEIGPRSPLNFFVFDGLLYAAAATADNGYELWRTDGTDEGTVEVANIATGDISSFPDHYFVFNDELYFTATDEVHGRELRKLVPSDQAEFLRGDVNGDGIVFPLVDALHLLQWQFGDGVKIPCMEAADVDDSDQVFGIIDASALLNWGFFGTNIPPEPGPDSCGSDPNAETLIGCEAPPLDCL